MQFPLKARTAKTSLYLAFLQQHAQAVVTICNTLGLNIGKIIFLGSKYIGKSHDFDLIYDFTFLLVQILEIPESKYPN